MPLLFLDLVLATPFEEAAIAEVAILVDPSERSFENVGTGVPMRGSLETGPGEHKSDGFGAA